MEWKKQTLLDTASLFEDGNWIESKDQSPKGILLVQTGNVGVISYRDKETKRYISEETFERLKCTEIFAGDILISRLPDPIGRACIIPKIPFRMITAVDCTIYRPKTDYDTRYVNYCLNANYSKEQVYKKISGSSRKRISRKNLGGIELPIPFKGGKPDLVEQKRIADKLDMLFAETEKGLSIFGKQKKRVQKIYQTVLSEFFGNTASSEIEWKSLKFSEELFKINTRTIDLKNAKDELVYLDIDAVKSGSIVNPKKISKKSLPSRARRIIKEGDVLIASVRPYLKSFAVVPKEYDSCVASTGFFVVERNVSLEPRYIFHFAMSELFINQTNSLVQGGSYPALNKELMGQISIPIPFKNGKPDLTEQKRIADELEKVSTQSENLSNLFVKQSKTFSALRSSVLNQSFQMQT